ncbi:hypothetical protein EYF80_007041 [Liparis tanakae]|uniref:Uncharacterized protein n=1 Tax=Liparis tanakae TaxID=230148 RepID=A0A4Z2IXU4_9TELE|nr:hypothetical protein EYF80_007041 [Liparis tanakae]
MENHYPDQWRTTALRPADNHNPDQWRTTSQTSGEPLPRPVENHYTDQWRTTAQTKKVSSMSCSKVLQICMTFGKFCLTNRMEEAVDAY